MLKLIDWENDEILEKAIEAFEEESGEQLFAGDERLWLINAFMYIADVTAGEINHMANNNLIMHCDENVLMMKAEERYIEREPAKAATVNMKFTLAGAGENITIPKGTRATAEGELFFELTEDLTVPAGNTSATAVMTAVEEGKAYNRIAAGKITIMVDTVPYVTNVVNTSESEGGRDIEDLERFRMRVLRAPSQYNTTGAEDAYVENAKDADATIIDVKATNDGPEINIYVLCQGGTIPGKKVLDEVEDLLTQNNKKAITDRLHVQPATPKNYAINLSYKISQKDYNRASEIQEDVSNAVQKFVADMQSQMNIDINPEILRKYIYNAGASSVTITSPVFTAVQKNEVAKCTSITVTYSGTL